MSGVNDAARAKQFWLRQNGESLSRLKIVGGVPRELANSADEHGSPVTVDPVDWYICFVPGLRRQWWHRFVHHKHKHVFAMRPTNTGSWLLVEPWWTRMMVTILPLTDAVKFLQWGATGDILRVREAIPGKASQLRGWSNCAVLAAFLLGRSSWAWTPHGLYRELLREKETRHVNVEQLLIDQFAKVVGQYSSNASSQTRAVTGVAWRSSQVGFRARIQQIVADKRDLTPRHRPSRAGAGRESQGTLP